ncbi:MAG: DUF349 domain-containing protein [Comamonas sp.]|nr:DUF349 domain-containing protein [Comamonas sp.]
MSDAPELNPSPAKNAEAHPLDALTGGAFSAATSGDRAARIRDWLAAQPTDEQLQEVFKELSIRDKSVARLVRERMDDIRRAKDQEVIAVEWAEKAQALLAGATLNVAEAVAWQRDAAKAGAPLSREPLSALKQQLVERVKTIEDLQHRVQVQREAAVLLAQRIEVLSTKPWRDAEAAQEGLRSDVAHWQAQATELTNDASWTSVNDRFPPQLDASRAQLLVVWEAYQSALALTQAAAANDQAELPPVPVWADEIRVARGLPSELVAAAPLKTAAKPVIAKADAAQKQQVATQMVVSALQALTEAAEDKKSEAISALRAVLKQQGRWLDDALALQVHEQLLAAGDAQGWQPKNVDRQREELVAKAESLLNRPDGQTLGGRKLQETLRQLREQWKQADQGAAPNHSLWKKFDEACNAAYKQVEVWLERVRAESTQHKASRSALIEEVKAWAATQVDTQDLKGVARSLRQFAERWRDSGHVGEKVFAELQTAWKQAMNLAEAPLHAAQKSSLDRRHAMIAEAQALADAPSLRIDAVKDLQQRWQAEAQAVPLDRKHEQKLWDAFRKPLDDAFNRKGAERSRAPSLEDLSQHDRAVVEASKALQAANASGDVQQIRAAMDALENAVRHQPVELSSENTPASNKAEAVAEAVKSDRPVVAVRGDDRPGAKKDVVAPARDARPAARKDTRAPRTERSERPERGPRLGDVAFRAQRDAVESAQFALRKLAAQAHGEALTKLVDAWSQRDGQAFPSAQELGGKVTAQVRNAWVQAVAAPAKASDVADALLRLEIASETPTPAEHMAARRMLQLQLLTRRNAPAPEQTWIQDVAVVLASAHSDANARRLQNVLKPLLRK